MKKLIIIFGMFLIFNQVAGQNFKQQFNNYYSKKDTIEEIETLKNWKEADKNDPELYVAYFNYYVTKSKTNVIALGNNPKGDDAFVIMDKDTTKKAPVGYMYSDSHYDPELIKIAFEYIDSGIKIKPSRLDMRFGKIYMYGEIGDYESFTTEIIKTIDYSPVIKNKWTWTDNKLYDADEKYFLGDIQNYVLQLYDTQDDSLLDNMKRISETVLKYYPNHIESLTNISIVYILKKEYDKAIVNLLKAEKLNPQDAVVLSDIARAYKLKGDKKNAIKYYDLAIKFGDDEAKDFAKKAIEELKTQ